MKNNKCFISGNSKIGKTTAILNSISKYSNKVQGFITARVKDENGAVIGYSIENVREVHDTSITQNNAKNIFLVKQNDLFVYRPEVLREYFRAIKLSDKLFIMDEIGGVELLDEEILKFIYSILKSDIAILGTIKGNKNFESLKHFSKLGIERDSFIEKIKQKANIVECDEKNQMTKIIEEFVEKNI